MLNLIKSKTKKFICCFVLCLGVLVSAFAGYNISNTSMVMAKSTNKIVEDVTSSVFGTGYNFNTTTSDEPVTPNGWTKLDDEASSNKNDIKKGVVNVEDETSFDTDECGTTRPSMPIADKDTTNDPGYYKNLMINATKESGPASFGYRNSSAITLEDDSFYRISVLLYTQQTDEVVEEGEGDEEDVVIQEETDPRASIYLTGLLDEDDENYSQTKFEYFSTLGAWEEYYFYIATDEAKTVNIQLWLGSKTSPVQGAVFFNNVSIIRYSEDAFAEQTANLEDNNDDNFNIISLRTTPSNPFVNSDFEDVTLGGWTRLGQSTSNPSHQIYKSVDVNSFTTVNDDLTITAPGSNCSESNTLALFMYNKVDGYQAIESQPFTVNKQTYYKLTFWAKSDCATGNGATVMLVDNTEDTTIENAKIVLSTTVTKDSNKFRNDWTQYTICITGPASGSKDLTVQIWLGTQDSKTTGYVFVDDFKIETIDYETFNGISSNNNTTTFDLNTSNENLIISNGSFNRIENSTGDNQFPAKPKDWTIGGNQSSTTFSGVINTNETSFAEIDFPTNYEPTCPKALPNTTETDNNVLMIGSIDERNAQSYTSGTLTIAADSYTSISLYVMTDYRRNVENKNYGARLTLVSDSITIFDYQNIYYGDNNWHKIEIRIKNGKNELTPKVDLQFENCTGFVFFDKIENKTLTEAVYNNTSLLDKDVEYYYVDFTQENFDNRTYNKISTSTLDIETPNNWTLNSLSTNKDYVNGGIITSNNTLISDINPSLSGNTNYLYISSLSDTYYAYTGNQSYTFNSETYYKISVNVLTRYLNRESEKEDDVDYGASIKLTDSSEIMLCGIDTQGVWKTYTIYASFTESLTSTISLALGYTEQEIAGDVLFDKLTIETITEATYLEEYDVADPTKIATFIDYTEPKDEEEEEDDDTWSSEFDWILLPSILTGLAIIIAVVGYYIRKIRFNRKPKIKTNYDRRKTLDKDIDRREKIALRQQIIEELNAEISIIDKEIEDFNALANQQLEELRAQIKTEQEDLEKSKLEIEIKKKEATAAREKQLKETPDFVADKKAEKDYNNFIARLDRQELAIQKKIVAKELKISTVEQTQAAKRNRYLERQEYIRTQIAKIEAEIEEIAKQEAEIWAEYKAAKADAKKRKAEYKAQIKADKEKAKKAKERAAANKAKTSAKSPANKNTKQSTTKTTKAVKKAENTTEEK